MGKIETPSQIGAARLASPTQALDVKFVDGSDHAVAGTYRVQSVRLLAEGELPDGRARHGDVRQRSATHRALSRPDRASVAKLQRPDGLGGRRAG